MRIFLMALRMVLADLLVRPGRRRQGQPRTPGRDDVIGEESGRQSLAEPWLRCEKSLTTRQRGGSRR